MVYSDSVDAQIVMEAKTRLSKTLRSKSTSDINVSQGDLVELLHKLEKKKTR